MIESTSSDNSRFKRELQSAAFVGGLSGAIDLGFRIHGQKQAMKYPDKMATLEDRFVTDTLKLSENKEKRTGFIGKIFNFKDEKNLKFKQDELENLAKNKLAVKSLAKGFVESFILWGLISLGFDAILDCFRKKEE